MSSLPNKKKQRRTNNINEMIFKMVIVLSLPMEQNITMILRKKIM